MKKFYLFICLLLCLTFISCSDTEESHRATMNIDVIELSDGTTATRHDGTEVNSFEVSSKPIDIRIVISKISGSIDILIYPEDDKTNYLYEGHNIELPRFTVTVSNPGRYEIFITCKDLIGSYKFEF